MNKRASEWEVGCPLIQEIWLNSDTLCPWKGLAGAMWGFAILDPKTK